MEVYYQDLGHGITCIDTLQQRRGLAACYLIEQEGVAGFIDTGTRNSVPILREVLRRKRIPEAAVAYVMPTHVHLDHAGGAGALMQVFERATLLVHPRGAQHLINPAKLEQSARQVYGDATFAEFYGAVEPVEPDRVQEAGDEFELDFNGRVLQFLHTEGHARHHYCIYDASSEGLFTGDTFGVSYPELNFGKAPFIFPPATPTQFDPEQWQATLQRLLNRNPARLYLTHFGMHREVDSLARQLQLWIREYVELAREYAGVPDRESRLAAALLQQSINYLLDQQCGVDADTLKQLLRDDMALNAKGLDHWLGN